jgi:HEAT repeat protein
MALNPNLELAKPASALLSDPAPEVRRAAMLAVGVVKDAVMTDDLLNWLHDSDGEVRRLCELELRGRGLQDDQVRLGRLITDPSPRKRLEVLNYLYPNTGAGLDAGVWLRHLSHDPAPEVRFAAIRAVNEDGLAELNDRIDQMARNDPSPTICDFARRCLASQKRAFPKP